MTSRWPRQNKHSTKVTVLKRKENFISPMLYDVLSCITPHPNYETISKNIIKYLPKDQKSYTDGAGNILVKVGQNRTTMFSCHIDMVFGETYQANLKDLSKASLDLFIAMDQENTKAGFIWGGVITDFKDGIHTYTPTTLGADDKAGVFIMLNLIRAKVPGLYVFHTGEELGGIGSSDIVTRSPTLVKGIKRAIAFDRMDYFDIINRQKGGMCCSLAFVNAFAEQLNDLIISPNKINKKYTSSIGSFTDTANYTHLIPECTNLSVGYFYQHFSDECLDTLWLEKILTPALLKLDWEALPTTRSVLDKTSAYNSQWPQKERKYVGKYVTYASIDYLTKSIELPPWSLKKGLVNSCTDIGMRRLINHYLATETLQYNVCQAILDLLKENAELKQKSASIGNNGVVLLPPAALPVINGTKDKQERVFSLLKILTNRNFQVYKDHYSLYPKELAEYAEVLEWTWQEAYRFEEASEHTLWQVCVLVKEILAEIVVVNTTLVGETNYVQLLWGQPSKGLNQETQEVYDITTESIKFLKDNWCRLGYSNITGVQSDLKRIRDKIAAVS